MFFFFKEERYKFAGGLDRYRSCSVVVKHGYTFNVAFSVEKAPLNV